MTGKELVLKALKNEETPRPAWVPFVGCHGGHLIDRSASEYLKSSDLLVEGLTKAIERYKPDGLPIAFDLQIEAEVLGASLNWADDVPPAVTTHPLSDKTLEELPELTATSGRVPIVLDALDTMVSRFGDDVLFYGLVCGPFTLALHLMGNDIFLEMFDDANRVKRVMDYAADIAITMSRLYIEHGAGVIAVVDPMTSQVSPEHFEEFVTPALNKVFDAIREQGGLSSIFVCGDVTRNLELMCATRADNVSVDEQIDMGKLASLCKEQKKSFGGNIKLTSVLLLGSEADARQEVLDIIDACGTDQFILSPGCDLPYATPPANLEAVTRMVHDAYEREIARTQTQTTKTDNFADITPPDYDSHKEVVIDVITLDSTSCAPCQYMMEAVQHAANDAFVKVFVNEHKIKSRNGLGMMAKLGVKNLPTICIDGEPVFSSIIPDHKTLLRAIEAHAIKKNIERVM